MATYRFAPATVSSCGAFASQNRYTYFGLQWYGLGGSTVGGECWLSNSLSNSTRYEVGEVGTCALQGDGMLIR